MNTLPRLAVEPMVSFEDIADAGVTTPYSEIFRPDTHLGDVLGLALEKTDPADLFRVISAGCSFGAEIDATLAMVQYADLRRTAVLGIDNNPLAVEAANQGRYQMTTGLGSYERSYKEAGLDFAQTMRDVRFTFHPDEHNPGLHVLDTTELRAQHHVKVIEGDVSKGVPTKKLAHVVLCNNVLFHLDPATAELAATNLAGQVAPEGVLSFGANPAQTAMEGNTGMDYLTWLGQMGATLESQGLEPALFSQDVAFAFRRTSTS